ncbi:RagB/SusD family nutrient uptake outer membrane protein [Nonlabens xiamenensis]|uniref:RagB/SusD family nutrient uptake outer membrane protein n=1 Tax=Nonlabens xiamenensis TaxID=2341043 RepID=UPI0013DDF63A|nr:RagB/SusD family nutrient uptake outer membrane protein [Nonlabens xiamenensis]
MKTTLIKIAAALLLINCIVSCQDAIELEPISDIGADSFYSNTDEVELALIGAYKSLHLKQLDEWVVTELRSDNTQLSFDNSQNANVPYRQLDRFVSNPLNEFTTSYWRASYRTIGQANHVLENLAVVDDPEVAAQFEGEARFLRAHSLFNLTRLYGGVFVVTETIDASQARNLERQSVADAYAVILEDLQFGYDNLPDSYSGDDVGRVTKWAAGLELGKALLTQGTPQSVTQAEIILRDVVNMSGGRLLDNYEDVFDPNNEMNDEVFFGVRYQSGLVGLGSPFANLFSPRASENAVVFGGGEEFNVPTEGMEDIYASNDPRARVNFSVSWIDNSGNLNEERFISKYNGDFNNVEDAPNDWIISRYADALLLLAEAINENSGPTPEAIGYLNDVRNRAGQSDVLDANVDTFFEFKLALEEERRREFAFENHRWFDLVRTGRAVAVMNEHFRTDFQYNDPDAPFFNTQPIQEFQTLLPIPQYEIDLNPSVAQNVGY